MRAALRRTGRRHHEHPRADPAHRPRRARPRPGGHGDDASEASDAAGQAQVAGVDDILDEIDSVLETNAAAFVQGFVQKGGE